MFRVLIDLDGVLADFIKGACLLHGKELGKINEELIKNGDWDICKTMEISFSQFWKKITESGSDFWQTLEPLLWYRDVIKAV